MICVIEPPLQVPQADHSLWTHLGLRRQQSLGGRHRGLGLRQLHADAALRRELLQLGAVLGVLLVGGLLRLRRFGRFGGAACRRRDGPGVEAGGKFTPGSKYKCAGA